MTSKATKMFLSETSVGGEAGKSIRLLAALRLVSSQSARRGRRTIR